MKMPNNYKCEGQMSLFDLDLWSGKTSPEHSVQTKEKILGRSLKKRQGSSIKMPLFLDLRKNRDGVLPAASWEMGGALLGEYTMHSFGECPKDERESRLSQILEEQPHPKYCLSAKACQGILRRAEKRGKTLPLMLDQALRRQAGVSMDGMFSQSTSNPKTESLNPCMPESAEVAVENPTLCNQSLSKIETTDYKDPQAVVYGISAYDSNAMKSGNPNSGIYEAETSRTLDLNGGSPACNQGDMAVVCLEGNGSRPSHRGDGYAESDTMYTLNSTEHHAVAYRKQGHPQNAEQGQGWEQTDVNDTLNAFDSGESRTPTIVLENHPADSRVKISEDGIVQTLSSRMGTGGGNVPMVMESSSWDGSQISPTLTANNANGSQRMPDKDNFNAGLSVETYQNTTGSLCASGYDKLGTQEATNDMYVVQSLKTFHCTSEEEKVQTLKARDYKDPQIVSYGVDSYNQSASEEMVEPLRSAEGGDSKPKVCTYGLDRASFNQGTNAKYDFSIEEELVGAQVARGPGAVLPWTGESVVRRLTPLECTRLQGFPDGWVDIGDWTDSNGKLHKDADSPKYKALGNSIALPFWRWLAERIHAFDPNARTMASLFDGIGGFPLAFMKVGIAPVWASEIEEFPMAVTRLRFPE